MNNHRPELELEKKRYCFLYSFSDVHNQRCTLIAAGRATDYDNFSHTKSLLIFLHVKNRGATGCECLQPCSDFPLQVVWNWVCNHFERGLNNIQYRRSRRTFACINRTQIEVKRLCST